MKVFLITALTVLSVSGFAIAHMEMKNPPPLRSKFNKFTTNADYDMTSPMAANGANFPCKGHLSVLGSSQAQPVADWTPGQPQTLTITGSAHHNGGSCQASLSFDNGKSWKVIHSWVGNCPTAGESNYEFTLPQDTPAGQALFAWSWFNQVGNREMYMNCAMINVKGSGKKKRGSTESLQSRPDMFVANVGKGCGTSEGKDLMFPNPGPDVDMNSKNTAPPTGSCPESATDNSSPAPAPAPVPGSNKPSASSPTTANVTPTPTTPSNVNNGQTKQSTSTPVANKPQPVPVPAPTKVPETPAEDNDTCIPGAFACSSDSKAWQVCAASQIWVVSFPISP